MEAGETDAALEWRNQLALRLLRGFCAVFAASALLVLVTVHGTRAYVIASLSFTAAVLVGIPALTGRPSGAARGWMIIVPATLMSVGGYTFVGFLSGPGVCLTITLMLAGLLLGRRAMIGLAIGAGVAVALIGWAMVARWIPAPNPQDVDMTRAIPWVRSLGVTLFAIGLFGGMMIAVVDRMERSLREVQSETKRRERAESERAEAERVALEAKQLETIGRLAAGIAHDFNNNLTAIIGCAELLKLELENNQEALELSDSILQSSQRAAELTRQLLAYSRKGQMLRTPTDLHALITEVVSLVRRSTSHGIELSAELQADRHVVAGDSALLQSALLNLLINARDAMPDGGQIRVSTRSVSTRLPPGTDNA
ncbi:MAG TPA: histidine kinase dimerization/phospho-acceptor domain-containing protein, partial [Polyangiales bacterium]|nr:histidine kinase dimerization/phospho-acceptor domain-containing protein [Polyangiales bacterium]